MEDWDDARLIEQILTGDDVAFDILIGRYRQAVFSWVRQRLPDTRYDQDLAQEVFIEVYYSLDTLHEPCRFRGWLRQIVRNVCISWLRRQKRIDAHESHILDDRMEAVVEFIGSQSVATPEALFMERETYEELELYLSYLSEIDQELMRLFYLRGLSYREISEQLEISSSAIKSRLHRAREKLKGVRKND